MVIAHFRYSAVNCIAYLNLSEYFIFRNHAKITVIYRYVHTVIRVNFNDCSLYGAVFYIWTVTA